MLEILSWIAACGMILNYWLVSIGKTSINSIWYHLAIGLTSLIFALYSMQMNAWPNAIINFVFVLVSLRMIIRIWIN